MQINRLFFCFLFFLHLTCVLCSYVFSLSISLSCVVFPSSLPWVYTVRRARHH